LSIVQAVQMCASGIEARNEINAQTVVAAKRRRT